MVAKKMRGGVKTAKDRMNGGGRAPGTGMWGIGGGGGDGDGGGEAGEGGERENK